MDTLCVQQTSISHESDNIDVKTGVIFVIISIKDNKFTKSKMYMKVFKNSYEHHAQIFTDTEHRFTFGSFSLRNCRLVVDGDTRRISITNHNISGDEFMFEAETLTELQEWVESLTPNTELSMSSEYSPEPSPQFGKRKLFADQN